MFAQVHTRATSLVFMPGHTPGERLRQLRERLGLSLREAAKRAETISYSTLRNVEQRSGNWEAVEIGTLRALARAYGLTMDELITFAFTSEGAPDLAENVFARVETMEVHPDWVRLSVFAAEAARDIDAALPLKSEVVYIPREHLTRKGVHIDSVRVFHLDGSCAVSDEARRMERTFAAGDYVAIDATSAPKAGDVVVAWWPERETLVLTRYLVDAENVVLHSLNGARASTVLPLASDATVIGPVVWRGG